MLHIGIIDYLNFLPIWAAVLSQEVFCPYPYTAAVPSKLNHHLFHRKLDLSFISSIEFFQHQQNYVLLPYCIAAEKEVLSVNLYLRNEVAHLDHQKVALTTQSATSSMLLKVLCHHFWHVQPYFYQLENIQAHSSYEGFLLIGDEALLHPHFEGYQTIDLAQAWHQATKLPFCFAVCAVQKNLSHQPDVQSFLNCLEQSLQWGEKHRDRVLHMALSHKPAFQEQEELLSHYFSLLHYRLGETQKQGLQHFWSLAQQTESLLIDKSLYKFF